MARGLLLSIPTLCVLLLAAPVWAEEGDGGLRALEVGAEHAVLVTFRFQRDLDREERGAVAPDPRGLAERYRFWRSGWVVPGFVLGDRRTVLISDPWISRSAIESITVRTRSGVELPGRLEVFLGDVGGAIVKTEAELPVEPLTFEPVSTAPARYAASVTEGNGEPQAWVEDLTSMRNRPWSPGQGGIGHGTPESPFGGLDPTEEEGTRTIDLVCDDAGTPLGFRFGSTIDAAGRWRGPRVLASRRVSLDALGALEDERPSPLHRLTVTFRTLSRHDRDRDPFRFGGRGTAEEEYWGLAITPDTLVVPELLEEEKVRRVLSIRLDDVEAEGVVASYAGKVEGYQAFVVRVEGVELDAVPAAAPPSPATDGALLVHRTAQRGGARRDQVDYDRVIGRFRGYGDRSFLATERAVGTGALLRDLDGRVLGFSTRLDPVDKERRLSTGNRSGRSSTTYPVVAVLFDEVGLPATLAENLDTRVMPQEETAARRLPWLGVETDGLDEGLAKLLDVSGPTRDGRRGLVVTVVYEGSPAARAGLVPGDVLLSARRTSAPGGPAVDLRDAGSEGGFYFPGMLGGGGPAPWRSRATALVSLLQDWGSGTTYELVWLHEGATSSRELTVEQAPPDFRSAPRHFDEVAGLEVRDLTYEVRRVLRMGPEDGGVVVARIEPGSPAAQARIEDDELILELDGQVVPSAEAFGAMLEAAREASRPVVRLVVQRLGKTRIVDLRVESEPGEEEEEPAGADEEPAEDGR
jgi:hypothetical protein